MEAVGWALPTRSFSCRVFDVGEVCYVRMFSVAATAPVILIYALLHPSWECRVRPLVWAVHKPVLDRIVMDVVDMPLKVSPVANGVFPESTLPYVALTMFCS